MSNPTSEDIKDVLVAEGIGTFGGSTGWCIFIGKQVDTPDTVITILDSGGSDATPTFDGDSLERPTFDIQVRAQPGGYETAFAKIYEIDDILHIMDVSNNAVLSAENYVGIWRISYPFFVAFDEKNRPIVKSNYRVFRYKS